jgi:PAS domain S-box-containing protein
MNLFQFMALFSAVATLIVGLFSFFGNPGRKINLTFFWLSLVITVWQLHVYMGMSSDEVKPLIFWIRQSSAIAALIPPSMNLIRIAILNPEDSLFSLCKRNFFWFLGGVLTLFMCQTTWFLKDAIPPSSGQYLPTPVYGVGFMFFGLYFLIAFGLLFYQMFQSNRRLKGREKAEIEYLLLSCGAGLFIGIFFLIVPSITGWNDLGAMLPLSVMVFTAITGYGIATRGILDVPVFTRRIIAYTMLFLSLCGLYFGVLVPFQIFLRWTGQDPDPIAHLLAAMVLAFAISPAKEIAQNLTNRLFSKNPALDVGKILREAGSALNTVLTVDELCQEFDKILRENLETTDLRIFVKNKDFFTQIFPVDTFRQLPQRAELAVFLSQQNRLCVRDLIQRMRPTHESLRALKDLKTEKAAAAIGMQRNHQMIGFLLLGPRRSGRIYAQEEALAVEGLRDLFAVSFENAQLYTEVQNGRIYMDLLLKNLVNGVIATDASGTITTCNQEAAKILKCQGIDLKGKNISSLPADLYDLQKKVFEKDHIIREKEIVIKDEDGEPCFLNTGASLFRDLNGSIIGSLLVLQDRTAIRKLEEQVKRSERLASLGTLSAGMAHEIKNPLVTLQTFTQLLPERFHDEDYRETFVNLASKEIGRIDGLVNKLLTLARPIKLELGPVALHSLLEKYIKVFRQQAEESKIQLIENYQATNDLIQADADQLRQVLLNLLLNAQQAMPEGGDILLSTCDTAGGLELTIKDSGEGISPEVLAHVFDPFFTTKSAGTGLGLAVAHQILEEHHARVRVESRPGKGSAFIITFPQLPEEAGT